MDLSRVWAESLEFKTPSEDQQVDFGEFRNEKNSEFREIENFIMIVKDHVE